jgi:hypothetical protein
VRSALLLAAIATVTASSTAAETTISRPYVGLTYIATESEMPRPVRAHVLQIDLSAPGVHVMLTPPRGDRETTRETTAAFVERMHAQAGINAHFFLPFPSPDPTAWLIGLAASEGRVYSVCESPEQSFALVANAPAINIDRRNHASVVHCAVDPGAGRAIPRLIEEDVEPWTMLAGSAQIVTDGAVTIPEYRDADHPGAALTAGSARNFANGNSWYDVVTARSAIGISRDGRTLTLFTVDARGGSTGMTVGEVAQTLVDQYDVWNALNIDGGGSTSLALADPATGAVRLVNTSSDNPTGRLVGSSLIVFAQPRAKTLPSATEPPSASALFSVRR